VVLGLHVVQETPVDADLLEHGPDVGVLALVVLRQLAAEVHERAVEVTGPCRVPVGEGLQCGRQAVQVAADGGVDQPVHRQLRLRHAAGP
jgi:hypothetical protein